MSKYLCNDSHWCFPVNIDIDNWYGFIYRIVEIHTGKEYIGKKQFWSMRRRSYKGRKNKKLVYKESDWKTYTGSSNALNAAIEKNGKENYLFFIESLHETKGNLYYAEVEKQVKENVLREQLKNGLPKFYNGNISAVKFKPKTITEMEKIYNVSNYTGFDDKKNTEEVIDIYEKYYGPHIILEFKKKLIDK